MGVKWPRDESGEAQNMLLSSYIPPPLTRQGDESALGRALTY